MAHVLVVEDDRHIRDLIALHLGLEGLECTLIGDGRAALERLSGTPFDLVVLDLMLPGVDGLTLCKALRRTGANTGTPVLMLTARGEESDKVLGLESGADDYLAKPFGIREFVARVWPGQTFVTPRSVDTLVKRLRKRIERDTESPTLVLTVWGAGYKFADV